MLHVREKLDASAPGHGVIEDRDVPIDLVCEIEGLVAVACFADDVQLGIVVEHRFEALAHDGMIVGDENLDRRALRAVQNLGGGECHA